jgi:hypothetical protein
MSNNFNFNDTNSLLYIQVKLKIDDKMCLELSKISEKINQILSNFEHTIDYDTIDNKDCCGCMPMPEFELINIYVQNHENNDFFENFLDNLRKEMPFRYMIKCFNPSKKHPSSTRINVKGEKIITKQQTKLLGL